jgi:hypothetical protein
MLDEKAEKKKEQNNIRQTRFYLRKKEEINAKRREKYKECVAKCYAEANEGYDDVFVPDKPLFTYNNKKIIDLSKHQTLSYDEIVKYLEDLKLTPSTLKKYKQDIKWFMEILGCDNVIKCFKNHKDVIKAISKSQKKDGELYSNNTRKGIYQMILFLIDRFNLDIKKDQYLKEFNAAKLQSIFDTEKQMLEQPVMRMSEFIVKVKDYFGIDSKMYAIIKLYNEVPVRDDFQLKIVEKVSETQDENINYIIMKGKTAKVIINRFKTHELYGAIKVTLTQDTTAHMKEYAKRNNLEVGDYLFGNKELSGYVTLNNNKIGVEKGFTTYRKMKISEELSKVKSIKERQALAEIMGHSPMTQLKYVRKLMNE